MADLAEIAVVGGSGFYEFLEDAEEVKIDTPFGAPSDPITVGEVAGRRVAFLPRHGRDHRFPPHKIPYRANMWALRSVGVRRVLAPTAGWFPDPLPRPGHPGLPPTSWWTSTARASRPTTTRAPATSRSPIRTARRCDVRSPS